MHYHASRRKTGDPFVVEPPLAAVLPGVRKECRCHAFGLDAQHHHYVRSGIDGSVQIEGDRGGPALGADGQKGRRADELHAGAERREQPEIGSSDPRVQDVAHDGHRHPLKRPAARSTPVQSLADRERVEQRLRRMLVGAVPRVDDAGIDPAAVCQDPGSPGCPVPDDHGIRPHCGEGLCGVFQALALRHARPLRAEVDHIRTEALGSDLERYPRARGVFEEEIDNGFATEGREFLHLTVRDIRHVLGDVEDGDGLVPGQVFG